MNARKIPSVLSGIAIVLLPACLIAAVVAVLVFSPAADEVSPAASAQDPSGSSATPDPTEPQAPEILSVGLENSGDGAFEFAGHFFDLVNFEFAYGREAGIDLITTGTCRYEQCWQYFIDKADRRTAADDIQYGGGYYFQSDFVLLADTNKAYVFGELFTPAGAVYHAGEGAVDFEEESLGEVSVALEFAEDGWKVFDVTLEDEAQEETAAS